jgi:hypothetical protein
VDLPVAPGQDVAHVLSVTEGVVRELNADPAWRDLLVEAFSVIGFERVGNDGALLRVVARARPGGDAARLSREARLRLLQRWMEQGIQTPGEAGARSATAPEPAPPPLTPDA